MQKSVKKIIGPPKLIPVLVLGFNFVANNLELILFPIVLDVFFWFGPLIRIRELIIPVFDHAVQDMAAIYSSETMETIENSRPLLDGIFERFNLLFSLRTFPVGIPSLMWTKGILQNPFGKSTVLEMHSFPSVFGVVFLCFLLGAVFGSGYFRNIARVCMKDSKQFCLNGFFYQVSQSILMLILLILVSLLFTMPSILLVSSISAFLPALGIFPLIIFGFILFRLLIPLVFMPHGIFIKKQNIFSSIAVSARLVRYFLPETGLFILVAITISYGLDLLWSTPSTDSWLMLVGIIGHAFISTGVIVASFIYYRKGLEWMEEVISQQKRVKQRAEF